MADIMNWFDSLNRLEWWGLIILGIAMIVILWEWIEQRRFYTVEGYREDSIKEFDGFVYKAMNGFSESQKQFLLSEVLSLDSDEAKAKLVDFIIVTFDWQEVTIYELLKIVQRFENEIGKFLQSSETPEKVKQWLLNGELPKAEQALVREIESFDTDDNIKRAGRYSLLGELRMLSENYEEAEIAFKEAAKLQPDNVHYQGWVARANMALENYDKALKHLDLEQQLAHTSKEHETPILALSHLNSGHAWQELGELDKAISCFEKTKSLMQEKYGLLANATTLALLELGELYETKEDYDDALACYKEALGGDTKVHGKKSLAAGDIYYRIARVFWKKLDYDQSGKFLNKLLACELSKYRLPHPSIVETYWHLARVWDQKKNMKKAILYFEKALTCRQKLSPAEHLNVGRLYTDLGIALNRNKQYDEAISYFARALTVFNEPHNEGLAPARQDIARKGLEDAVTAKALVN